MAASASLKHDFRAERLQQGGLRDRQTLHLDRRPGRLGWGLCKKGKSRCETLRADRGQGVLQCGQRRFARGARSRESA